MINMEAGDIVLCINGKFDYPPLQGESYPIENEVYVVREIAPHPVYNIPSIKLEEIKNPPRLYRGILLEISFDVNRFKKLDELNINQLLTESLEEFNIN